MDERIVAPGILSLLPPTRRGAPFLQLDELIGTDNSVLAEQQDLHKDTPLHVAATYGQFDVVKVRRHVIASSNNAAPLLSSNSGPTSAPSGPARRTQSCSRGVLPAVPHTRALGGGRPRELGRCGRSPGQQGVPEASASRTCTSHTCTHCMQTPTALEATAERQRRHAPHSSAVSRALCFSTRPVRSVWLPAGWTPFLCAVSRSHIEIADFLLRNGASLHYASPSGMTAMHIAGALVV